MIERWLREEDVKRWGASSKIKRSEVRLGENSAKSLIKFVGIEMGTIYRKTLRG